MCLVGFKLSKLTRRSWQCNQIIQRILWKSEEQKHTKTLSRNLLKGVKWSKVVNKIGMFVSEMDGYTREIRSWPSTGNPWTRTSPTSKLSTSCRRQGDWWSSWSLTTTVPPLLPPALPQQSRTPPRLDQIWYAASLIACSFWVKTGSIHCAVWCRLENCSYCFPSAMAIYGIP